MARGNMNKRTTRQDKIESGSQREIKPKFLEDREEQVKVKPLVPMSAKQREYMQLLQEKSIVVASGLPGTSKTYIPTAMAADAYRLGKIEKIIVTRPAISSSRSMGFYPGSETDKLSVWLNSVIPIFKDRLGVAGYDIAVASKAIEFVPLEVIKGMSINDAWVLVEESSDLTKDEVIKLITRLGRSSRMTLSGDVRQAELKGELGLVWLIDFVQRHGMNENFGFIDFGDVNDIVRSDAVKQFITAILRDERAAKKAGLKSG